MRIHFVFSTSNFVKCGRLFRLSCSTAATTSRYYSNYQRNFLQCIPKSYNIQGVRFVRGRFTDEKKENNDREASTSHKENEEEKTENGGEGDKNKLNPATIKKLRIYILVVAGLSFVSSFILLSQMFTGDRSIAEGVKAEDFNRPGISFDSFASRYLQTGEVKKIIFVPANNRAIAILHRGAIIDGNAAQSDTVVVEYQKNAQQFWADIRKAEGEIGIGLSEGVHIDLYQGLTTFKVIEMLIGVMIIAWLGTQYGRLLRKRILENRAKQGTKN